MKAHCVLCPIVRACSDHGAQTSSGWEIRADLIYQDTSELSFEGGSASV